MTRANQKPEYKGSIMSKCKIYSHIQNNLIEHKEVTTMEPTYFES
jgi:hypothetical protein